tara:strand:+ start:339 stop:629 length:291 start_codon:yes stop_codon:yes gene_type:complete
MSPENKKNLKSLRKQLDRLDYQLINIIKKRTEIVKKVILVKKYKKEIVDRKRIKLILKKIRNESIKRKIDPKITNRIWKNMIWSYINFERSNFKKK